MAEEYLVLKWGNLKAWNLQSDRARAAARALSEELKTNSAMEWLSDTAKDRLCDLIDAVDGPISNDWSGESYDKQSAKEYVRNYGTPNPNNGER